MVLTKCRECEGQLIELTSSCPNCGATFPEISNKQIGEIQEKIGLFRVGLFRNRWIGYIAILSGIFLLILPFLATGGIQDEITQIRSWILEIQAQKKVLEFWQIFSWYNDFKMPGEVIEAWQISKWFCVFGLVWLVTGEVEQLLISNDIIDLNKYKCIQNKSVNNPNNDRTWVWYSTPESVVSKTISLLSFFETAISISIYVWMLSSFGTLHLVLSAILAPLLLLRTNKSTKLGLSFGLPVLEKLWEFTRKQYWNIDSDNFRSNHFSRKALKDSLVIWMLMITSATIAGVISIGVRVVATVVILLRHPIESISSIPKNWWRYVACIDIFHPPQLLPGVLECSDNTLFKRYPLSMGMLTSSKVAVTMVHICGPEIPLYVSNDQRIVGFYKFFYIPSILYRWSLKGSSLIYSPLLWVANSLSNKDLWVQIDEILHLKINKIIRVYSLIILLFLFSKAFFSTLWNSFLVSLPSINDRVLMEAFIVPNSFPYWQIASGINASLAWVLLIVLDYAWLKHQRAAHVSVRIYSVIIKIFSFIRTVLSIYTIAITIYIAVTLYGYIELPQIENKWFPWN